MTDISIYTYTFLIKNPTYRSTDDFTRLYFWDYSQAVTTYSHFCCKAIFTFLWDLA